MMKASYPIKSYDSVEYGILLPDNDVVLLKPGQRPKSRGMSCGKCLCLTLVVVLVLFLTTSLVVGLCGYMWMKHQVQRFTTDEAVPLPIHDIPNAELEIVKDRAKLFYDSIRAGQRPTEDLVLTQDELNGFLAHSDYLRGNAFVRLTENHASADLSLPAKGLPGGKGRYFVGTGALTLEKTEQDKTKMTTQLETLYQIEGLKYPKLLLAEFLAYVAADGTNTVNIMSGQFLNWVVPADCIEQKENLLAHLCDDQDDDDDQDCQDFKAFLDGLGDITIGNESITFHAAGSSSNSEQGGRRLSSADASAVSSKTSSSSFGSYARRSLMKYIF